jgi:hypothetical protein
MAKDQPSFSTVLSALFATVLLCGLSLLAMNKFSIWGQLGAGEKFWTIFALIYAIVLTLSGWLYGALKIRAVGLLHAMLMLGIAGLVLYEIAHGAVTNPGVDNAAAGIVAGANVVFIIIGVLAASCGVALVCCLFPAKKGGPAP